MKTDILSVLRRLRSRWAATFLIFGTAAISVAAFLALTAVVDGLLLKQPFPGAEHVSVLGRPHERFGVTYFMTRQELAEAASRLRRPVAAMGQPLPLGRSPLAPLAAQVSTNFFDLVGVRAIAGRTLTTDDEGQTGRAVISESLWRTRFGADRDIVNRTVALGDKRLTVVGVIPSMFRVPDGTTVWTSMDLRTTVGFSYRAVTRHAGGPDQTILQRLPGWRVLALREHLAPDDVSHALVLLGAGALLLGVVWTCFALIQSGEIVRRAGESRLRLALGATRWRATRASVVEGYLSLFVCVAAGTALAPAMLGWLVVRLPPELIAGYPIRFDARTGGVALVVLAVGMVAVTVIALPALARTARSGLAPGHGGSRVARHTIRSTRWIVALQFAVATPVLYVLGLAASSFHALVTTDLGFRPESVVAAQAPRTRDGTFSFEAESQHIGRLQLLMDRVSTLPGVEAVAMSSDRLGFVPTTNRMRIRLREADEKAFVIAQLAQVSAGYFDLMGIPRVSGRTFEGRISQAMNWKDVYGGVVVDTTLAAALGRGADVVGRDVVLDFTPSKIIGVVEPIRARRPDEPIQPRLYVHISPAASFATNLLVRFGGPADATRRTISLAVQSELGTPAPVDTVLLTEELNRLQSGYRGRYQLLSLMGWIAAVLSGLGMFGVGSYAVARRRRELALRMAVGASRGRILSACLSDLIIAASGGVAVGLAAGVLIGRSVNHLLYGVAPVDPIVLGGVLSLLGSMVVAGAFLPIRDAWRTDVSAALRQE
jgi:hypothetical protein